MERSLLIGIAVLAVVVSSLLLARRGRTRRRPAPGGDGAMAPSTAWREQIAADEAERFDRYAREYVGMQKRHLAKEGAGRAVHRKQVLGLRAELEVLSSVPSHAGHGLFRKPGRYPALVRLSNGAADKKRNGAPDLRGFALHVAEVAGPGAMAEGDTSAQDFILLNHASLPFANVDDFTQFGIMADAGPRSLLGFLIRRYGVLGIPARVVALAKLVTAPFAGFAHVPFNTVAPLACGPYAVRVQLAPSGDNGPPPGKRDWSLALRERLRSAPLTWDLQLQFFCDEERTPIEDMSIAWPTPYVTVARLTVPVQDADDPALAQTIEAMTFDAWRHALAEHRPLGNVMRARKVAYAVNAAARGARL